MKDKSFEWWIGQGLAIYLGIAAYGEWKSGVVASLAAYTLMVLIDIRENTNPKD